MEHLLAVFGGLDASLGFLGIRDQGLSIRAAELKGKFRRCGRKLLKFSGRFAPVVVRIAKENDVDGVRPALWELTSSRISVIPLRVESAGGIEITQIVVDRADECRNPRRIGQYVKVPVGFLGVRLCDQRVVDPVVPIVFPPLFARRQDIQVVMDGVELCVAQIFEPERVIDGPAAKIESAIDVFRRGKGGLRIGAVRIVRKGYLRSRDRFPAYAVILDRR